MTGISFEMITLLWNFFQKMRNHVNGNHGR